MARRFTRGRFVRPAPRTSLWIGIDISVTVVAANASVLLASLNANALALRPFTIIRSRMLVTFSSDQTAASEQPRAALGGIVADDKAVALGITAVPAPLNEVDGDWYYWQGLAHDFVFVSGVGVDAQGANQYIVDSKAMRKVSIDEDMAIVIQETGVFGCEVSILGRQLIKLH